MILSSPFSRQNRSHQSWHSNGSGNGAANNNNNHFSNSNSNFNSLRLTKKPAPNQPAPLQPPISSSSTGSSKEFQQASNNTNDFRSHTLNRLDLLKARQQANKQQSSSHQLQRRNVSSSLGLHSQTNKTNQNDAVIYNQSTVNNSIYAPASIASPNELASRYNNQKSTINHESQHYAATSCKNEPTTFTYDYRMINQKQPRSSSRLSTNSGRESVLKNLCEKFGTLKRRLTTTTPRRSWSSAKSTSRISDHRATSAATPTPSIISNLNNNNTTQELPTQPPFNQPTLLDPDEYNNGKKEIKAEEIYAEGLRAIDGNHQKRLLEYEIDESLMFEGETRYLIEEESKQQVSYQLLVSTLTNWINDELYKERILVKDLQDDLYDGQILSKLLEKLHDLKLDLVEVTQNELTQKYKLKLVLEQINRILTIQARNWARIRWSVEGIHGKNLVEMIHLLVTLARFYKAPIKLPANVRVRVLIVQKYQNQLIKRLQEVQLTDQTEALAFEKNNQNQFRQQVDYLAVATHSSVINSHPNNQQQRDVFDTLIEFAPEKLIIVKQSLVKFVNRHLNKINMSCFTSNDLKILTNSADVLDPQQFSDGLLLVFLISSLENYFVPLGNLFTSSAPAQFNANDQQQQQLSDINGAAIQTALEPASYINTQPIHKLHNVNVAIQLIEEAGLNIRDKIRAEDIVNGDLRAVLRILYALFSRYKHL